MSLNPQSTTGLLVLCSIWGMAGSFISLQLSRFMAKRTLGVRLVDGRSGNAELDRLYNTVQNLAQQAGLPMPEVGVLRLARGQRLRHRSQQEPQPGGRLLRPAPADEPGEVQGVLAHEVAHIKNGDMVTMALIQGVINAFVMFFARIIASMLFRSDDDRRPGLHVLHRAAASCRWP